MVLSLAVFLTGCESMMKDWQSTNCNKDAAYAGGMNDARAGKAMNTQYAGQCPPESQAEVREGYKNGYTEGLASVKGETPLINVVIGGSGNQKDNWFCETEAFGKKYSAWGPNQLKAKQDAIKACSASNHEMHCDDVECQQSR